MEHEETNPDGEPESGDITLWLLQTFTPLYGAFALFLSFVSALLVGFQPYTSSTPFLTQLAVYGVFAGAILLLSSRRIRQKRPDAPRWIRLSMLVSLPGAAVVGLMGYLMAYTGVSLDSFGVIMWGPGVVMILASAINLIAFLRVAFFTDLDALLWEGESARLAPADFPNFVDDDDDDVEIDFDVAVEEAPVEVEVGQTNDR